MLDSVTFYLLPFSFTLLVACVMSCLVSALFLYMNIRTINQAMRHPYLKRYRWEQMPATVKLTITLDYFLRLMFPRGKFWVCGQANRLLADIDPRDIPLRVRWPVVGFWGGCFLGILSMLVLWLMILITMN
ncbi:hypothetical protein H0A73_15395 [Alcaligenaceae bacterium]|nr:hypothetical protein [Alcaligenaceae bacterium]